MNDHRRDLNVPVILQVRLNNEIRFYPDMQYSIDEIARLVSMGQISDRQLKQVLSVIDPTQPVTSRLISALWASGVLEEKPDLMAIIREGLDIDAIAIEGDRGMQQFHRLVESGIIPRDSEDYQRVANRFMAPTRTGFPTSHSDINMTAWLLQATYSGLFERKPDEFWEIMSHPEFVVEHAHEGVLKTFGHAGLFRQDSSRTLRYLQNLRVDAEPSYERTLYERLRSSKVLPRLAHDYVDRILLRTADFSR